jgi:hypothetical protein
MLHTRQGSNLLLELFDDIACDIYRIDGMYGVGYFDRPLNAQAAMLNQAKH